MTDLVALLRKAGLNVRDERVDPRPGSWSPMAVLNHHTATKGPALTVCKTGRRDLAGPLCNINITRQGVINVVCDGRANHAGKGSSVVAGDIRSGRPVTQDAAARNLSDDTDGNTRFYGIEVDNDGVGEPLTGVQQDALIAVNAALVSHFGWSPNACIHHRQWTRRKTDMRWRGDIPALVRFYLQPHTGDAEVYEARTVTIPPPRADGAQVVAQDVNGKPLGVFHHDVVATIKSNDDGRPVRADVQVCAYGEALLLSFVSLDGGPVGQGNVEVILGHPTR